MPILFLWKNRNIHWLSRGVVSIPKLWVHISHFSVKQCFLGFDLEEIGVKMLFSKTKTVGAAAPTEPTLTTPLFLDILSWPLIAVLYSRSWYFLNIVKLNSCLLVHCVTQLTRQYRPCMPSCHLLYDPELIWYTCSTLAALTSITLIVYMVKKI